MPTLEMMKGLPASGKSSVALARVREFPNRYKRVNKDDLRDMLDGGVWSKGNEKFVLEIRDAVVVAALNNGKHVIVDDTNLHPKHEEHLRELARTCNADFRVNDVFLQVSPEECIERDLKRNRSVGHKVIWSMYNNFLKPPPVKYEPPKGKPKAVIVDIDGTIAHMDGRSPYEWHRVDEDIVDHQIADLIRCMHHDRTIIFLSGRDGSCYDQTEKWLIDHKIPFDELYMRAADDVRKDAIIKKELFEEHIRDNYQVCYVLDDRNQVVKMWREEIGLKVFQVADGDF